MMNAPLLIFFMVLSVAWAEPIDFEQKAEEKGSQQEISACLIIGQQKLPYVGVCRSACEEGETSVKSAVPCRNDKHECCTRGTSKTEKLEGDPEFFENEKNFEFDAGEEEELPEVVDVNNENEANDDEDETNDDEEANDNEEKLEEK